MQNELAANPVETFIDFEEDEFPSQDRFSLVRFIQCSKRFLIYLELDSRYLTESAEYMEMYAENTLTDFCQIVCTAMRKSGCNQPYYARIIKMPILKKNLESACPKKIVLVKYRRG